MVKGIMVIIRVFHGPSFIDAFIYTHFFKVKYIVICPVHPSACLAHSQNPSFNFGLRVLISGN